MKTYLPQLFNKPSKKVALILSLFLVVISGVALSSPLPQERKEDDFIQTWDALSEKWIAQLDGPG